MSLVSKKGEPARRVSLLAELNFYSHVNGSPRFVRNVGEVGSLRVAPEGK